MAEQFDIVFVGSGLSSSAVLRSLLVELKHHPRSRPVRIAVVERGPDFFGGVAYGSRSGDTARVISPLDEFLDDTERERFVGWLQRAAQERSPVLCDREGELSEQWLIDHLADLESGDSGTLYVPRRLYGRFLDETMRAAIAEAERSGLAAVELRSASVDDINFGGAHFRIVTDGATITSDRVVLGIGVPPGQPRLATLATVDRLLTIAEPYEPGMSDTVARIAHHLQQLSESSARRAGRVAIIGSNATMLDLIYQCEDDRRIAALQPSYCAISPSGTLPARHEPAASEHRSVPHLAALMNRRDLRACDVVAAIVADRKHHGVTPRSTAATPFGLKGDDGGWMIPAVSQRIAELVKHLPLDEQLIFANRSGVEIGRLQRRAGDDYLSVVDKLKAAGRFTGLQGTFESFVERDAADLGSRCDVIIDASGRGTTDATESQPLKSLRERGVVTPTASGDGLVVNERYEAAPGLFVMGPLLAGNVLAGRPIWHLEQAGRIITMSATLGRQIGQSVL